VCPDCKTCVHCGSVGLANLKKNHHGKKICVKAREKCEKEEQVSKWPNLLSFFNQPKVTPVPLTILRSTHVQGIYSVPRPIPAGPTTFLQNLYHLIESLPNTVPEAFDYDKLAIFEGNPMHFDDLTLDVDSLWETVLNAQLKSVLGWGKEEDLGLIIWRGRKGLDSLANFVKYLIVKQGVKESLFEGKLLHLMTTLQKL